MKSNINTLKNILKAAFFSLAAAVIMMSVKTSKTEAQPVYLTENQNSDIVKSEALISKLAIDEKWKKPIVPVEETVDQIIDDPITDLDANFPVDSSLYITSENFTVNTDPDWLEQKVTFFHGKRHFVNSIDYPQSAIDNKVEGFVKVFFVVEPDGRASGIRIVQSLDYDCDQAVIKAVHNAKFKPGIVDGKAVRVHCILPVYFGLDK